MSVELYFSNQLNHLGEKLAINLKTEYKHKSNIFDSSKIIVPNSNLKKWLQMVISDHIGIAINLDFKFLETGLWDMLSDIDPNPASFNFLDNRTLQLVTLFILQNSKVRENNIDLFHNYLVNSDQETSTDYVKRLWQLSERLAFTFREYEYHRPDMIKEWQSENRKKSDNTSEMEECQRSFYNRLFNPQDGLCSNLSEKPFVTLVQYATKIITNKHLLSNTTTNKETPESIHLFGLSQVSIFHQYLIGFLGEHYKINIYAFNPCCEFWEDVETRGEQRWRLMKNAKKIAITEDEKEDGELQETDNQLLQWWGKPGRENIKLLSDLTDYNFHELFCLNSDKPFEQDSVLERLQRHILFRTPAGDGQYYAINQDCSLQIVGCPGILREVETVYNNIIYNLEADAHLNLTDIAILVPDMKKYKTAITSVFQRLPNHVSYNLVDATADRESIFGQGVIALLELAQGTFSRRELFNVMFNPCFQKNFNISRNNVQTWAEWCNELNIFHCFDIADKKSHGYNANSEHTWQHGLKRLRLARIMNEPQNVEVTGEFVDFNGIIPFDISGITDFDLIDKFSVVVELLFAKVKNIRSQKYSCAEWINIVKDIIDAFLDIPDNAQSENSIRQSLFETIEDITVYDELQLLNDNEEFVEESNSCGNGIDLEMIIEFVNARLKAIQCSYGSYLTGGVTISEMQPMRPIPFRIVYVMGLGEGEFPGRANQSLLDLRLAKRKIGDINRPESNRYMFLEILTSTREKLYLTYVSKDLQKDEDLLPCSVIHQLTRYIESEVLVDKKEFEITQIPLKGSSLDLLNAKITTFSDVMVNYSEADRLTCYLENGIFNDVKLKLTKDEKKRIQKYEPTLTHKDREYEELELEKITLAHLRQFILNPAEVSLKNNLNLYEEETEDKSFVENEPFFSGFPLDYNLVIKSLEFSANSSLRGKSNPKSIPRFFDDYYADCFLKGITPETGFCERDKEEFKKNFEDRLSVLYAFIEDAKQASKCYESIFFGTGNNNDAMQKNARKQTQPIEEQPDKHLEFNPISLNINDGTNSETLNQRTIEIHGSLPTVWFNASGWNTIVLTTKKKQAGKLPEKYVVAPFLLYIVALSSEETTILFKGFDFNIHILYAEKTVSWRYQITPEVAKQYLTDLVTDYIKRKQFDLLPFEAIVSLCKKLNFVSNSEQPEAPLTNEVFKSELEDIISENIELSDLLKLSKANVPNDALEKAKRRLTPILSAGVVTD